MGLWWPWKLFLLVQNDFRPLERSRLIGTKGAGSDFCVVCLHALDAAVDCGVLSDSWCQPTLLLILSFAFSGGQRVGLRRLFLFSRVLGLRQLTL